MCRLIDKAKQEGIVKLLARGNQLSPNQYQIIPSAGTKLPEFKPSSWVRADKAASDTATSGAPAQDKLSLAPAHDATGREHVTSTTKAHDTATPHNHQEPSISISKSIYISKNSNQPTQLRAAPASTTTLPANIRSLTVNGKIKTYDISEYAQMDGYLRDKATLELQAKKHTPPRARILTPAQQAP